MNEPDRKYRCIVCGDRTHMPIAAALEHFKLYRGGQWRWLKGNMAMAGRWSGFWSTCYLAFPILNTLRFWKYRKATLELPGGKPLESAFDANGCAIRQVPTTADKP
jgi:hypothetical protein